LESVIVLLVVIATSIWVGIDAGNLGMQRGRLGGGMIDMSVAAWVVCCLLVWIIAFPCYLVARGKYQGLQSYPHGAQLQPAHQAAFAPPHATSPLYPQGMQQQTFPVAYQPPPAPPQMSPDGQWWWNGQQWIPVTAPGNQPPSAT
jgi:hypothetical protein